MATLTFDTLELVDKLKSAGFVQEQAEAVVRVIADAQQDLVTPAYLKCASLAGCGASATAGSRPPCLPGAASAIPHP
jgi:hypothetical protein